MGFIYSEPWFDDIVVRNEPKKAEYRNMIIWGPITRPPVHTVSAKKNLPKVHFCVDLGRVGPATKQFVECLALGDNPTTRFAKTLQEKDTVIAVGVLGKKPYYSTKYEEWRDMVEFRVNFFIQDAGLFPMELLRPTDDGEADVFESENDAFADF